MTALSELLLRANGVNPLTTRARAQRIGNRLHFGTIANYQRGDHPARPDSATLQALAEAYGLSLRQVQAAAGVPVGGGEWTTPAEMSQLTRRQQAAVSELIRAIAEGGGRDVEGPAPIEQKTGEGPGGEG